MSFGSDWVCGRCGWGNLDVRKRCRNCSTPKPAADASAAEAFRCAFPDEYVSINGEAPVPFSFWRLLGFRQASPPLVEDIEGFAAGRLCVVTVISFDWRDRLRLLISGKLQVATSIMTDVPVSRSQAHANTAVLPPGQRS